MFHRASLFHFLLLLAEPKPCVSDLQSSAAAVQEKAEVEAAKGAVEGQAGRLTQEAERLRRRAQELENEVAKLNRIIDEAKLQESRLGDKVGRLEVRGEEGVSRRTAAGTMFTAVFSLAICNFLLNRKKKSNWKSLWLKSRSKKRRCHVPTEH